MQEGTSRFAGRLRRMHNNNDLRQIAANCRKAASSTQSPSTRDALSAMATEYDRKAEQEEAETGRVQPLPAGGL